MSKIANGYDEVLYLGNLNAQRDWGHAKDFVRAMWLILQYDEPEDWVISTGKTTSVRDFVCLAFDYIGVKLKFIGTGLNEIGVIDECLNDKYQFELGKVVVKIHPNYFRPTEVDVLVGDSSKARKKLEWQPEYTLENLVSEMMDSDIKLYEK